MLSCILFEDEHLLVVNKPAGLNTHAPAPFAGEGIYDWLRNREPRWSSLAIIHRLDKDTSGVIVFGKSPPANRSLTEQFTARAVRKKYLLVSDRPPRQNEFTVKTKIIRNGDRYTSAAIGEVAETRFRVIDFKSALANLTCLEAEPLTGRTHQIRVHAAENGFPILGDTLYGGTKFQRVCLHAAELSFRHPTSDEALTFKAAVDFALDARAYLRYALIDAGETNAFRLIHGASDGWPGWYVERLGAFLHSQSERGLNADRIRFLDLLRVSNPRQMPYAPSISGVYHKALNRQVRRATVAETSPQLVLGEAAPGPFVIRENGLQFEMSFSEGYSVGLFLDQRDNRRRFLTGHIAARFDMFNRAGEARKTRPEILNTFAYTCGFSVCAAKSGGRVTSLDLSKKYLEWGRRNFALNDLDPTQHDFIFGDVFDWLRRLAKKGRSFEAIILDPPTFSQSKEHGAFRVERDYSKLVTAALRLLKPAGVLFASTNAATWPPENFVAGLESTVKAAHRKILQSHFVPQPPDFPTTRGEPAYLKTLWLRIA